MRTSFRRVRAVVVLALILAIPGAAWAVSLVKDGRPEAQIAVPAGAMRSVTYAAEELQYHIEKACGAKLPIVAEDKLDPKMPVVYVGPCEAAKRAGLDIKTLPPNGYFIKCEANALFLCGDDDNCNPLRVPYDTYGRTGTAFAVYDLLENNFGVRWLWPGPLGEVVPQTKNIALPPASRTGAPRFRQTRWFAKGDFVNGPKGWASEAARKRYFEMESQWMRRHRFAQDYMPVGMTHPFVDFSFWKRFSTTHPEFFQQLPDGTRGKDPTQADQYDHAVSMCVSQPAVAKQLVEDWANAKGRGPYIGAGDNDGNGRCTCEACMAMDAPNTSLGFPFSERLERARKAFQARTEDSRWRGWPLLLGPLSDRYARYYMTVLQEARKVDPKAIVWGTAYANWTEPPREAKLNQDVIISVVPPYNFPFTDARRESFFRIWKGWSATGALLFLRPNYTLCGHNMPVFFARKVGEDLSFAAANGMFGAQFDFLCGQWGTQGPNMYMIARMLERPDMAAADVLKEYYGAFGPAADAVSAYFAHWESVADALTEQKVATLPPLALNWEQGFREVDAVFTPESMARGRELMDQAVKAAQADPVARERVAFLEKGLRHAELTLAVTKVYRDSRQATASEPVQQALRALDAYRAKVEGDLIANMTILYFNENRGGAWARITAAPAAPVAPPSDVNWGFEETAPGQYNTLVPKGDKTNQPMANLTGWSVAVAPGQQWGVVSIVEDGTAPEGKRFMTWVSLTPFLQRQVKTEAGKPHTLKFRARGVNCLKLFWNDTALPITTTADWKEYTFTVTGGGTDTLKFQRSGENKPCIDDISVTAVAGQ